MKGMMTMKSMFKRAAAGVMALAMCAGLAGCYSEDKAWAAKMGEDTMPIAKLVEADSKEFKVNDDVTVLIAQRETVDLPCVMGREAEIREHMKKLVEDNGYEFALLLVTDILAEGSQFIVEGDAARVNRVFDIECTEGGNWMPGVLSRKKQVAAPILAS